MIPSPWGGSDWEGPGLRASEVWGEQRHDDISFQPDSFGLAESAPKAGGSRQLVLSYFSPRSRRKNPQLHVPSRHFEQSDGAPRHGPPAGVHRLWGVCTVSPHFWLAFRRLGRAFVHALFCHIYGYKKRSRQPLVRTLQIIVTSMPSCLCLLDKEERRQLGILYAC